MNKNLIMLIAHPDDEVIFGWMVLKQAKEIICCTNDNNPSFPICSTKKDNWINRQKALEEIGRLLEIRITNLGYNSDFYQLPDKEIQKLSNEINHLIKNEPVIFTHNSWGEYGHKDHILVHNLAKRSGIPLLVSDIKVENTEASKLYKKPNLTDYRTVSNDWNFYQKCKTIYEKYNCWTWNQNFIESANLYIEKNG